MTNEEAARYLIMPTMSSTNLGEEVAKQLEAYAMARDALINSAEIDRQSLGLSSDTTIKKESLKWERIKGVMTPGGDPLVRCPVCKSRESEHLIGIESPRHWKYCPICGERLDE